MCKAGEAIETVTADSGSWNRVDRKGGTEPLAHILIEP